MSAKPVGYRNSRGWDRAFSFCGDCHQRRLVWVRHNLAWCSECRPDWRPDDPDPTVPAPSETAQ